MPLVDKVVLVTGASRGIGHAIAMEFAQAGATVIGTATTTEGAGKITQAIVKANTKGRGYVLNVSDEESVTKTLEQITRDFGAPLILINNAGITRDTIALRMKTSQWDEVINTNLNGVFRVTKACLKPMVKQRWGRIINISSVVGVTGNAGQTNYTAAKAAVIGFSKSLAQELAVAGTTVNVVAPGFIDTDMTRALNDKQREMIMQMIPMRRMGKVQEIAKTVLFLASDDSSYITGQTLHVNGGMYMP